jgi:hypothetical protein
LAPPITKGKLLSANYVAGGLKSLDVNVHRWSIKDILDVQVKLVAMIQFELNGPQAQRNVLGVIINLQQQKVQECKDCLQVAMCGRATMKEEFQKVEFAFSIVQGKLTTAKVQAEEEGANGDMQGLTKFELENVGHDLDDVKGEYKRVEVSLKHA